MGKYSKYVINNKGYGRRNTNNLFKSSYKPAGNSMKQLNYGYEKEYRTKGE